MRKLPVDVEVRARLSPDGEWRVLAVGKTLVSESQAAVIGRYVGALAAELGAMLIASEGSEQPVDNVVDKPH